MKGEKLVAMGGGAARCAATFRTVVRTLGWDAVALRVEDDEAARAFAGAGCLQAGVVEEEMKHAALAGVHGREAEGLAGFFDVIDGGGSGLVQSTRTGGFEAVGVEGDAIVVVGLEAQHLGGEVFEGAKELTIAGQKKLGVGALALDVDVATLEAVGIRCPGTGSDAVFEAKTAGGGQQPHQSGYLFCSLR
jgi:hypothetical protein